MKRISYLLIIIVALGFASCGKDGSVGPTGPAGINGDAGLPGAPGKDGKDGNTILSGTSNPTATTGNVGDFYINTNSYVIFGPKTISGWNDSKSILGPKGDKGDTGAADTKGDKGDTGATGPKGDKGAIGPKGDKGDTGATGPKGDKGDTGATGPKGDKGDTGAAGPKGDKGDTGAAGPKGDKGDTGAIGPKGEADYVILSGAVDPTDAIGNTGDFYFNTTTKTLFYRYIAILNSPAWGAIAKLSNTIQFSKTINMSPTDNQIDIDIDLPRSILENSMLNVYLQTTTTPTWYPLPGYVGNNVDELRIAFHYLSSNSDKSRVTIYRVSGNRTFTDAKVRVVVTEAEVFRTISRKVDFKDYNKVSDYFKLNN